MSNTTPATPAVLVVEDNDAEREGLAATLRRGGFRILEATTGDQALEILSAEKPCLILLDLLLPEGALDGWSVLDRIRENPAWAAIPVIIVTGLAVASLEWSTAHGAVDLVRKPADAHELLGKIQQHCRGA